MMSFVIPSAWSLSFASWFLVIMRSILFPIWRVSFFEKSVISSASTAYATLFPGLNECIHAAIRNM